jgi:hypothetical protein
LIRAVTAVNETVQSEAAIEKGILQSEGGILLLAVGVGRDSEAWRRLTMRGQHVAAVGGAGSRGGGRE